MTEEKAELLRQAATSLLEVFPNRKIDVHVFLSEKEIEDFSLYITTNKVSPLSENVPNITLHINHKKELDGR